MEGGSSIRTVSLNQWDQGVIGGNDNANAYAAFIAPGSTSPILISGLPMGGNSAIGSTSVGGVDAVLNNTGQGLIGGNDNMNAYAAWVSFGSSVPIPITQLPMGGNSQILGVALTDSGLGLIGGSDNANAYAAWVEPGSTIPIPINGLPMGGGSKIYSVSLNDFDQGLIGGTDNNNAYAALLAPGSTTPIVLLDLPDGASSIIRSVMLRSLLPTNTLTGNNLRFANYINRYAPQDVFYFVPAFFSNQYTDALQNAAPTRNALSVFAADEALFYLNQSLSLHLHHNPFKKSKPLSPAAPSIASRTSKSRLIAQNLELATDPIDAPVQEETEDSQAKEEFATNLHRVSISNDLPWTFWVEGIGVYASQKKQHQTVGFQPYGGGVILATDKKISEDILIGGGVAYTYTHVHEDKHSGHSDINQEFCFFYMNWNYYGMHLDSGLWFGSFQTDQVRNIHMTAFDFKSTSHPWGLQFSPHLELGYNTPIMHAASGNAEFVIDPFFMLDWINNWQDSYKENGRGPFNAGQKAHYSSFLRSEIGYRVYEAFPFSSWRLILEEKLSYVNKTPFGVGKVNSFLVGSPGSFTVETLTSSQNLGAAQMSFIFEPFDPKKYPLGSFFYQAEFNGSSFQSHQVSFEGSWEF